MILSLEDRIYISSILPVKGDMRTLRLVKDIALKIEVTQEEIIEFDFKPDASGKLYTWNQKGVDSKIEVEFTSTEKAEIKKALVNLEQSRELLIGLMDLYTRFVEQEDK